MGNILEIATNVVLGILVLFIIYKYIIAPILARKTRSKRSTKKRKTPIPDIHYKTNTPPPPYEETKEDNQELVFFSETPESPKGSQATTETNQETTQPNREEQMNDDQRTFKKGVKNRLLSAKEIITLFPGVYTIPVVWAIVALIIGALWVFTGGTMATIGPEYVEIGFLGLALAVVAITFIFILALLEIPALWVHMKNKGFIKDFQQLTPFQRWVVLLASLYFVAYVTINSMQLI